MAWYTLFMQPEIALVCSGGSSDCQGSHGSLMLAVPQLPRPEEQAEELAEATATEPKGVQAEYFRSGHPRSGAVDVLIPFVGLLPEIYKFRASRYVAALKPLK